MDAVKSARKMIEEQYGFMTLPVVRSPRFLSLIRGTRQLVNVTTTVERSRRSAKSLSITFDASAMASTDEDLNVKIPSWYCYVEALEKFVGRKLSDKEATAVSIALINGSSIHEGLHVAHSRDLFNKAFQSYVAGLSNSNLYGYILNVIEDLKNESILERPGVEDLWDYINTKNEIFFTEDALNKTIEVATKMYESDPKSIALELLVNYKCIARRDAIESKLIELGLNNVITLLKSACTPLADVKQITETLYAFFLNSEASKKEMHIDQMMAKAAQKVAEKYAKISGEKVSMEIEDEELTEGRIPDLIENDITNVRENDDHCYNNYIVSTKYGFISKLKIARQILPSRNEPRTRGTMLMNTRLAHIATDGKMFTTTGASIASMQKKQPEYILLGDFSGSMSRLIGMVNETLRSISGEMVKAGIAHSVYGHTSLGGEDIPIVYHIFSHKMNGRSDTQRDERFNCVKRVQLRQNYDGYAIRHVSKKFNKHTTNKVLIVLSDGQPAGPHYNDSEEHTIKMIEHARKNGIKVISLSLTEEVMENNDRFYGKQFNVDATSQAKLETGLQRIILGG